MELSSNLRGSRIASCATSHPGRARVREPRHRVQRAAGRTGRARDHQRAECCEPCRARARISAAFNGIPVTLADDALTRESTLTIERNRPRDAEGRPLDGRDPGRPEHFRLFKTGADCVLVQESTGRRWKLTASSCVAAPG